MTYNRLMCMGKSPYKNNSGESCSVIDITDLAAAVTEGRISWDAFNKFVELRISEEAAKKFEEVNKRLSEIAPRDGEKIDN